MQRILVCAQDPVLAKKVRFLMERDECKVEILSASGKLQGRLAAEPPTLLVLSRQLGGEDAIDLLGRLDASVELPSTLVLGGQPRIAADFIHLVPDPVDTQVIYREASRLLSARGHDEPALEPRTDTAALPLQPLHVPDLSDDEDMTLAGAAPIQDFGEEPTTTDAPDADEGLPVDAVIVQNEPETVNDSSPHGASGAEVTPLEPAAFARALYRAWHDGQGGGLVVEKDGERTTITFDEGRPVDVRSSFPGDPLGRALVARGRLTEDQYADAAKHVVERGVRLSEAVVELNFLDEEDLGAELGTSARELLVGCFSARDGQFWREETSEYETDESPYRLEIGHIIAQGLRAHADETVIDAILGEDLSGYFKLRRPPYELQKDFPLSKSDTDFLEFEGRAYNVEDASEAAGLPLSEARRLLAILSVTEQVEPFSPTAAEFESRIRDERETRRELESQMPGRSPTGLPVPTAESSTPPAPGDAPFGSSEASASPEPPTHDDDDPSGLAPRLERPPVFPPPAPPEDPSATASVPIAAPPPAPPAPPVRTPPKVPAYDPDIPPMPLPSPGEGVTPRPLAYAKPLPRGPDGGMLETPERNLSRDHFQKGVGLLGQGNFSSAEEAFRDAVALCSEEHVYLIGLARAIYYNPNYRADGKLPILRSIVDRAQQLAPDDKRVATLASWVDYAAAHA